MPITKPTDEQIQDALDTAFDNLDNDGCPFPGMSYTEGVKAALGWVTGQTDDTPWED